MKPICLLLTLIIFRCFFAGAQGVRVNNSNDWSRVDKVILTKDSGLCILAQSGVFGGTPMYSHLIKLDKNRDTVWVYKSSSYEAQGGLDAIELDDSSLVISTFKANYWNNKTDLKSQISLTKIAPNGHMLWENVYNGTCGKLLFSNDKNILFGGYGYGGKSGEDILLMKLDTAGNIIWKNNIEKHGHQRISKIEEGAGGYYFYGEDTYDYTNKDSDVSLIKTDSKGNLLLNETYGYSKGITTSTYTVDKKPNEYYTLLEPVITNGDTTYNSKFVTKDTISTHVFERAGDIMVMPEKSIKLVGSFSQTTLKNGFFIFDVSPTGALVKKQLVATNDLDTAIVYAIGPFIIDHSTLLLAVGIASLINWKFCRFDIHTKTMSKCAEAQFPLPFYICGVSGFADRVIYYGYLSENASQKMFVHEVLLK
ncbi:MAG: hypothetical protein M0D57_06045 [Sphingobacteriales bacterium JAD_PAG50586_3]|nr:MAG: hypothetical protein M0D57_06045 [Sphingobacteriales bacterium JAD_PAG50586_3]